MRRLLVGSLAATMLLGTAATAAGQIRAERPMLDYFWSRFDAGAGASTGTGQQAVGGRLMWPAASLLGTGYATPLERSALGVYVAHAPEGTGEAEAWRFGVQLDLSLAPAPRSGRWEPLASLGLGGLRREEVRTVADETGAPMLHRDAVGTVSVAPGVGLRLRVLPWIGLRADARRVIELGEQGRRRLELSGGLSVRA